MNPNQQIVEQYRSFVRSVVAETREQLRLDHDMDDLMNSGFRGLLEAQRRFDPSRGVRFQSFAYYRIRGAIIDYVRKTAYMPRRLYARLRAAEVLDIEAESCGETRAATAEMRSDLQAGVRAVDAVLGRVVAAYSVAAISDAADCEGRSPEEELAAAETKQAVMDAVETLPERERYLVRGFYLEGRTLDDMAKELGLSKSWVSRIHSKALDLLRKALENG